MACAGSTSQAARPISGRLVFRRRFRFHGRADMSMVRPPPFFFACSPLPFLGASGACSTFLPPSSFSGSFFFVDGNAGSTKKCLRVKLGQRQNWVVGQFQLWRNARPSLAFCSCRAYARTIHLTLTLKLDRPNPAVLFYDAQRAYSPRASGVGSQRGAFFVRRRRSAMPITRYLPDGRSRANRDPCRSL